MLSSYSKSYQTLQIGFTSFTCTWCYDDTAVYAVSGRLGGDDMSGAVSQTLKPTPVLTESVSENNTCVNDNHVNAESPVDPSPQPPQTDAVVSSADEAGALRETNFTNIARQAKKRLIDDIKLTTPTVGKFSYQFTKGQSLRRTPTVLEGRTNKFTADETNVLTKGAIYEISNFWVLHNYRARRLTPQPYFIELTDATYVFQIWA
ncbi:hypothetical protein Bca101_059876 [Brassica carinata]